MKNEAIIKIKHFLKLLKSFLSFLANGFIERSLNESTVSQQ